MTTSRPAPTTRYSEHATNITLRASPPRRAGAARSDRARSRSRTSARCQAPREYRRPSPQRGDQLREHGPGGPVETHRGTVVAAGRTTVDDRDRDAALGRAQDEAEAGEDGERRADDEQELGVVEQRPRGV